MFGIPVIFFLLITDRRKAACSKCTYERTIQFNFNGSNTDGSFTHS